MLLQLRNMVLTTKRKSLDITFMKLTGKNCVLFNPVQEWLFGCFWTFWYLTLSIKFYYTFHYHVLALFRMGFFGASHGWGPHISYNDKTRHSYTLPNEDPKMYKQRDTSLEFCWHQHFFTGYQQNFLHQEIDI